MPCNLVEMRNVAVNFCHKTRHHISFGGFIVTITGTSNLKQYFLNTIDSLSNYSAPLIKTVKQGTCCTSYLMPLALLFLPHTSSYFVLGAVMKKLPVFLLLMDSMTGMIFPAGLFSPHTWYHHSSWEGFGQRVVSSNARVRSASNIRFLFIGRILLKESSERRVLLL